MTHPSPQKQPSEPQPSPPQKGDVPDPQGLDLGRPEKPDANTRDHSSSGAGETDAVV